MIVAKYLSASPSPKAHAMRGHQEAFQGGLEFYLFPFAVFCFSYAVIPCCSVSLMVRITLSSSSDDFLKYPTILTSSSVGFSFLRRFTMPTMLATGPRSLKAL